MPDTHTGSGAGSNIVALVEGFGFKCLALYYCANEVELFLVHELA